MKNISSLKAKISNHTNVKNQFQLISVFALLLATILLGVVFKYSLNQQVRTEAAYKNIQTAELFLKKLKTSTLRRINDLTAVESITGHKKKAALTKELSNALSSVVKISVGTELKVYNMERVVVYSTRLSNPKKRKRYKSEVDKALTGEIVNKEMSDGSATLISWVPIFNNNKVHAVLEVYRNIQTGLVASKFQLNRVIWTLFLVAFSLHILYTLYMRKLSNTATEHEKNAYMSEHHQSSMAYHDPLTGMPNRELFFDRLVHASAKVDRVKEKLAVMFVDIDRFKLINDSLGYSAGNEIVKMVAERLQKVVRECDTVARVGGDEFTILLETIADPQEAVFVVNRVRESLSGSFCYCNQEINLTASIGISIYPEDEGNVEELVNYADIAKDKAKKNGGGDFRFYTRDMNISSWDRLEMEKDLRYGLERDQYLLHFQPKVDLIQGRITGMEALIRWQRTGDSLVSPGDFIPMLEETGIIIDVGEWVLRESCKVAKEWHDKGHESLVMAVNVSARQFRQLDFVDMVYRILDETGLAPELLEIEVTEGVLMEDTQASASTLKALKQHGIRIAIDDFGTGYSSLSYLQRYPIDTLKIDRAFVQDIENNSEGVAITTTIIALAHNLNLHIVAEGVETKQQLEFLTALGCQDIQGFLFSKPLAYNKFCELLENEAEMFSRVFGQHKNIA